MIVEEIMTKDVKTLTPNNTVKDALRLIHENKIRHIPLVNEKQHVVGIVTERDIKEAAPSFLDEKVLKEKLEKPLKNIMKKKVITAHPLDFVEEVAVIFYEHKIGCLPIVSDDKLVGIITGTNLLHTMVELTGANQPGSQIEIRVENRPGILYEVTSVFRKHNVNVQTVLVYPDKHDCKYKILVFRVGTINPTRIISHLEKEGLEVLWPNMPGMHQQ